MRIDEKDRLHGGVDAKDLKKYLSRFDPKEVKMGKEHEKEHTKNPAIAAEIASDHLHDNPHYYTDLKKAKIENIDVFEFNFHDILEIVWDDPEDRPLAAVAEPEKPKVAPTSKPTPAEEPKPASLWHQRREKYQKALSGADPEFVKASLDIWDKNNPNKGGRPYASDKPKLLNRDPIRHAHGKLQADKPPREKKGRTARQNAYRDVRSDNKSLHAVKGAAANIKSKKTDLSYGDVMQGLKASIKYGN